MAVSPMEDEELVLGRVARDDERAFEQLFLWYSRPLGEFVQRLTRSLDLTEEIIQDVFVVIWQRRSSLDEIRDFGDYLFILCRNHTYATLKKMATVRMRQLDIARQHLLEVEWASLDSPAESYRQQISQVVAQLPAQQRRAYSLSRYDRLKYEEIAVQMGISPETVKKHIQAAVRTIQKQLVNRGNSGILFLLIGVAPGL